MFYFGLLMLVSNFFFGYLNFKNIFTYPNKISRVISVVGAVASLIGVAASVGVITQALSL